MKTEDYELLQKAYRFLVENPDRWIQGFAIDNDDNVCAAGAVRLCSGDKIVTVIIDGYEIKLFSRESVLDDIWNILNNEAKKQGYGYLTRANDSGGYDVILTIFETVLAENAPKVEYESEDAMRYGPRTYGPRETDMLRKAAEKREPLPEPALPFNEV